MDDLCRLLRTRWWAALGASLVLAGTSVLAGCGSGDDATPAGAEISGSVGEWYVRVGETTSAPGPVNFRITNSGGIRHEFLVVRTDVAPGEITVGDDARFSETNPVLTVVDEIPEWGPGQTKTLSVDLESGSYQLVCNLPGHYRLGMWVGFTVSPR